MEASAERRCPSCNRDQRTSEIEVVAQTRAEDLRFDDLEAYFIGFRSGQCFFTYYRCACGLLWCPIYFTEEALDALYHSMPENTSVSGERDSERTQQGYVEMFRSELRSEVRVLELGADIGSILQQIRIRRRGASLTAIEPNRQVHGQLRRAMGEAGVIFEKLGQVPLESKVDFVVAIHVMDHLLSPLDTLEAVRLRMSGDSRLFIVVHDEASLLRKFLRRRWAPFCLQHPQLFSPSSLAALGHNAGFTVASVKKTSNWMSPRQAGELACSIGLVPRAAVHLLPGISFPVRLGNFAMTLSKSGE